MRRSPIIVVALSTLLLGLAGAACSKKGTDEAKPAAAEVASADVAEGDVAAPSDKATSKQAALAEKAKARQAARQAAKEAKEAKEARAAKAAHAEPADPSAEAPAEGEPRVAGTPVAVTPAEAAAAHAAAEGDRPLPPPNATGSALVARNDGVAPTPAAPPAHPAPVAQATPPAQASGSGVEIVVRDDEPLDLTKLVTLADVQKVVRRGALKQSETLAGNLPARDYNGVRFFASQNETLGVAVQVWRFPTTIDARRRYDLYSSRYPNAEKTDAVATQGFFAQSGDVLYLGFLDQAKKAVVIVSCSEDACDMKDLYVLARDLQKKL